MKQLMYQVEYPFVAVAWPMQNVVTIANLADKQEPHCVIHTDGLFLGFFRLPQYGDAIRLGYLSIMEDKLMLTELSVKDYHEKKQVTFHKLTEQIDNHFN